MEEIFRHGVEPLTDALIAELRQHGVADADLREIARRGGFYSRFKDCLCYEAERAFEGNHGKVKIIR
jgi:hypothetical protein